MPRSRKSLISLGDTPYYHYICRYVRRALLQGVESAYLELLVREENREISIK